MDVLRPFEFSRSKLEMMEEIGSGQFGRYGRICNFEKE